MLLLIFQQSASPAVGAFSGTGTASFVGASTAASVLSAAGTGAESNVGSGVLSSVLSVSGQGAMSLVGTYLQSGIFIAAGTSVFGGGGIQALISTRVLQKPVDYALTGKQLIERRGKLMTDNLPGAPKPSIKIRKRMTLGN